MTDYHSMSLVELKQAAKEHTPKIKQYYIKYRAELIQILTMTKFSEDMVIAKKTLAELRKEAQERKLPGIWKLRRAELVELLYPSSPGSKKHNKDDHDGEKHNDPKKREGDEVRVDILKDSA